MKLLLFTGAGASVELGIPAMRLMAEQFVDYLTDSGLAREILDRIKSRFEEDSFDIENIIEDTDVISAAQRVGPDWGMTEATHRVSEIDVVRMEAEWFVQHVCERANPSHAKAIWTPTLRAFAEHQVTIATTNYDRSIEIAAVALDIELHDGFEEFANKRYAAWTGITDASMTTLLKIHGSTDWYRAGDQKIYKLRHPMPLFGNVTVRVDDLTLNNAIILPSREKRITELPFQHLAYQFRKAAEQADVAVFLGTSLRDPHIQSICSECAEEIPTFLVCRGSGDAPAAVSEKVIIVGQCASRFLISSLPAALRGRTSLEFRERLESEPTGREGILYDYLAAVDSKSPLLKRLIAIDSLCENRAGCDRPYIETLLDCRQPEIRTHALGLIQDSPDRNELMEVVRQLAESDGDSEFKNECEMLRNLVDMAKTEEIKVAVS